jgi:hypothetical protein
MEAVQLSGTAHCELSEGRQEILATFSQGTCEKSGLGCGSS